MQNSQLNADMNLLRSLSNSWTQEAQELLNWWKTHMLDHKHGGFWGKIDNDMRIHTHAPKGVILNTRILWTFSFAARFFDEPVYRSIANRAYEYLRLYFWDDREGGVFWKLDYQGVPIETKKQIYAQAFAIYALSEYYQLSRDPESLQLAQETFWLMEKYSLDPEKGGYLEAFSRDWKLLDDLRLSNKDANEAKTMNTHLHVLEAYTNLYKVNPFSNLENRLVHLIQLFLDKFIDPQSHHLHLFFDENWQRKSDTISFGHDIEASWLLWESREALGDKYPHPDLLKTHILQMAESTLAEGWDENGGLWNERESNGALDKDKIWWVQVEAMLGFHNAYKITADKRYYEAVQKTWSFIQANIKDTDHGEWYWAVDAHALPHMQYEKAGPWKTPYHSVRALLTLAKNIQP